jgi:hypothetical protein
VTSAIIAMIRVMVGVMSTMVGRTMAVMRRPDIRRDWLRRDTRAPWRPAHGERERHRDHENAPGQMPHADSLRDGHAAHQGVPSSREPYRPLRARKSAAIETKTALTAAHGAAMPHPG